MRVTEEEAKQWRAKEAAWNKAADKFVSSGQLASIKKQARAKYGADYENNQAYIEEVRGKLGDLYKKELSKTNTNN